MSNLRIIVCFFFIFVLGGVTGWLLEMRFVPPGPPLSSPSSRHFPTPAEWGPQRLKQFVTQLDLTPEQVEKIRPIINKWMRENTQIQRKSWSQTVQLIEQMHAQILPLLTPEQQAKLGKRLKQERERREKFMEERAKRMGQLPPPPEDMHLPLDSHNPPPPPPGEGNQPPPSEAQPAPASVPPAK